MVPAQPDGTLEAALNRSLGDLPGEDADALRVRIKANDRLLRAVMPTAKGMMLWLRRDLPEKAALIIERTRHYYQLSAAA
jgi:hypothetical protein